MPVFRIEKIKNFTVISNTLLQDKNISLKAKGLMAHMLTLPDDWDYTLAGLATINRDGIDSVRSAVHELEEAGYIKRKRCRDDDGKFGAMEYIVYEEPQPMDNESDLDSPQNPEPESSTSATPALENSIQGNPMQINKYPKKVLKEKVRTKKNNVGQAARQEIVAYLNEKAQTSFRLNSKVAERLINARMKEGYTIDDFKAVIDCKVKQWGKNPEMSRYLRPETLFRASKFEGYVQEARKGGNGEVVETHDPYCGDFI